MQRKSKIGRNVVIGPHTKLGEGVTITGNSVIADSAFIQDGCSIDNSFICGNSVVSGTVRNSIVRGSSTVHKGSEIYASELESCVVLGVMTVNCKLKDVTVGKSISHEVSPL